MTNSYTAAVYPRSYGIYYTVIFPDFDNHRANNMKPDIRNDLTKCKAQLRKSLKKIIRKWKGKLPDPKFKEYDTFTSTYGDEICYFEVKI